MGEPEHISKPIKKVLGVLEVVYRHGQDPDQVIEAELKRRGLTMKDFRLIMAVPEQMLTEQDDRQRPLFDKPEVE
jgi:hypothetical protein